MDIARTYNYYPDVPLSDLSDLSSEGQFSNGKKLCVVSYLSKILRIGDKFAFNNKYVLFVQDTATVDNITWSYKLYNDNNNTTDQAILTSAVDKQNEYAVDFNKDLLDADGSLKFQRLTVSCIVLKGADQIELELDHILVKSIGVDTLFSANMEYKSFIGNPDTTNFLVNHIKDHLPKSSISWNNSPVSIAGLGEDSLVNYVLSIIYYKTLTYFDKSILGGNYYDISRNDNSEIEALILSSDPAKLIENPVNGISAIPLHLLNDMAADISTVPNFTQIDSANEIYKMLSRALVFGPDIENYTLNETENKKQLTASRQRFVDLKAGDLGKLVSLYNLTRFPMSAIRLTAMLFKFLLNASQKNSCNETLYKELGWKFLTLDGMKPHENLIKNVYSHYLEGPVNKVLKFRLPARTCAQYAWSPYIHTILNFFPRVSDAYFAKKFVVNKNGDLSCFFQRIDDRHAQKDAANVAIPFDLVLGREVYLVIETIDLKDKDLICTLHPADASMTGNTNKLPVMVGVQVQDEHTIRVGDFQYLNNNNGSHAHYVNLEKHHSNKAILKLFCRPQARPTFDAWSAGLNNAPSSIINIHIHARLSDNSEAYFGESTHATSGIFLNTQQKGRLRVVNRKFHEIYEPTNNYNFLIAMAGAGMLIGKIDNNDNTHETYYYHDAIDNEHFFGDFQVTKTPRWPVNNPNDFIQLVEATTLKPYNRNNVNIRFLSDNSPRDWVDLDCYAALLGAMAVNKIADLGFNGFSHQNGSPAPSVSHVNGVNGDLRYLRTALDGQAGFITSAQFDYNRQVAFNNSLFDYGFARTRTMLSESFVRNGLSEVLPHSVHFHKAKINNHTEDTLDVVPGQDNPQKVLTGPLAGQNNPPDAGSVVRHNDHLHVQGFDFNMVVTIL